MKKKVFQKEHGARSRKKRVAVIVLFFLFGFVIISYRCTFLHLAADPKLERIARSQYRTKVEESPPRGNIYDANEEELAISVPSYSLAARPGKLHDVDKAITTLNDLLKVPRKELEEKLKGDKKYVWIKRYLSPREKDDLNALQIEGLELVKGAKRFYPNREVASQILGAVGQDNEGLSGLELFYDRYLQGSTENGTSYRDARGRMFETVETLDKDVREAHHLHLTIRKNIQYVAEKELTETCQSHSAKSCSALVMDPHTGAILAMASYPSFNPNSYQDYNLNVWRNVAVTDTFEPGSTFKPIMASTALEKGVVKPDDKFFCENGDLTVRDHVIHDHERYGMLSVRDIIVFSSNIGIYKVGRKVGKSDFAQFVDLFGFGKKTGIDYPGEVGGYFHTAKNWADIDFANISFGQGIRVTPLQLATAYATIANGGVRMKPYIVSHVTDSEGNTVLETKPQAVTRVLKAETARTITDIMKGVTMEGGTATRAALPGYSVAGKTGTAQKVIGGKYSHDKFVASFVGIVPADSPRLVVLVAVDEPQGEYYGGLVAAPVFKKIAWAALTDLAVPPEKNASPEGSEVAKRSAPTKEKSRVAEELKTAAKDVVKAGLVALKNVAFDKPARELAQAGLITSDGGDRSSLPVMPDFRGLSKRNVMAMLDRKGLNCLIVGSGMADSQAPAPGNLVTQANGCRIVFEP